MSIKHGRYHHPLYYTWKSMMRRCYTSTDERYPRYGGRGIFVCARWHNVKNFCDDLEAIHEEGLSIDRIDNDGNYEPGNVRFADASIQGNNRSTNRVLIILGERMSMAQASGRYGVSVATIGRRLSEGWSEEEAVTIPARDYNRDLITLHGETMTQADAARKYGMNSGTLCSRLKKGMTPEEAVAAPVVTKKRLKYLIEGEELSLSQISRKYGVALATLRHRVQKKGMPIEQAAGI